MNTLSLSNRTFIFLVLFLLNFSPLFCLGDDNTPETFETRAAAIERLAQLKTSHNDQSFVAISEQATDGKFKVTVMQIEGEADKASAHAYQRARDNNIFVKKDGKNQPISRFDPIVVKSTTDLDFDAEVAKWRTYDVAATAAAISGKTVVIKNGNVTNFVTKAATEFANTKATKEDKQQYYIALRELKKLAGGASPVALDELVARMKHNLQDVESVTNLEELPAADDVVAATFKTLYPKDDSKFAESLDSYRALKKAQEALTEFQGSNSVLRNTSNTAFDPIKSALIAITSHDDVTKKSLKKKIEALQAAVDTLDAKALANEDVKQMLDDLTKATRVVAQVTGDEAELTQSLATQAQLKKMVVTEPASVTRLKVAEDAVSGWGKLSPAARLGRWRARKTTLTDKTLYDQQQEALTDFQTKVVDASTTEEDLRASLVRLLRTRAGEKDDDVVAATAVNLFERHLNKGSSDTPTLASVKTELTKLAATAPREAEAALAKRKDAIKLAKKSVAQANPAIAKALDGYEKLRKRIKATALSDFRTTRAWTTRYLEDSSINSRTKELKLIELELRRNLAALEAQTTTKQEETTAKNVLVTRLQVEIQDLEKRKKALEDLKTTRAEKKEVEAVEKARIVPWRVAVADSFVAKALVGLTDSRLKARDARLGGVSPTTAAGKAALTKAQEDVKKLQEKETRKAAESLSKLAQASGVFASSATRAVVSPTSTASGGSVIELADTVEAVTPDRAPPSRGSRAPVPTLEIPTEKVVDKGTPPPARRRVRATNPQVVRQTRTPARAATPSTKSSTPTPTRNSGAKAPVERKPVKLSKETMEKWKSVPARR